MNKNFKPKKFTRKEWQDNLPLYLKGLGVGAALDEWQKQGVKAKFDVGTFQDVMDKVQRAVDAIGKVKLGLIKATAVAKKQPVKPADTLSALDNYMTACDAIHQDLLKRHVWESKMNKVAQKPTIDLVLKDSKLRAALADLLKVTRDQAFLEAYLLVHKKKDVEAAVKKFGASNDYNIASAANKTLVSHYVNNDPKVTERKLKQATQTLANDTAKLLRGICNRLLGEEIGTSIVRKTYGIA